MHVFLVLLFVVCLSTAVKAANSLVTDGNFSGASLSPSNYTSFELGTWSYNSTSYTGSVSGWTLASPSNAYDFVATSGTATITGYDGSLTLASGSSIGNAPGGGNIVVMDPTYTPSAIEQTITGLTVGEVTSVTFYWGASQQSGYSGSPTEDWMVGLGSSVVTSSSTCGGKGSSVQCTTAYTLPSGTFSGWMQTTMTFIPTSTSEVLSFLAVGTGSPPMLLLADVSMAVPEPATWAVLVTGLLALGFVVSRRRMVARGAAG